MTIVSAADAVRTIALKELIVSSTGPQAERRAHFDKAAIDELAESIKSVGLLSPIIARPQYQIDVIESIGGGRWYPAYKKAQIDGHNLIGGGHETRKAAEAEAVALRAKEKFEVVAGERRFMAAKKAGLAVINVSVRALTDEQVLEIQLVENLQREGLHELAEAEGYEALQKFGHSANEIADKVGKSKAYVYARMKLLALSKEARKAFYEGKLNSSTALLLARIPVEAVQKEALKKLTTERWGGQVMSVRDAQELIHREYMTRLSDAGFPTEDAELVPAAGVCSACPKRTGNQPELFGDIKGADVCTDPTCFKAKREAHVVRAIAQAEAVGQRVISGKEAKKVAPYGADSSNLHGYKTLDAKSYEDPKGRTVRQLLGKDYQPTLLQDPDTGKLVKVAPEADVKKALKDAGVKTVSSGNPEQSAREKKAKIERTFRQSLFAKVRENYPLALARADWNDLALAFIHEMQQETTKQLFNLWGWEPAKEQYGNGNYRKAAVALIPKLSGAEMSRLLFDCIFVSDLQVSTWSDAKPEKLFAAAKRFKVNVEQLRRQINADSIPKAKKKAKAKK